MVFFVGVFCGCVLIGFFGSKFIGIFDFVGVFFVCWGFEVSCFCFVLICEMCICLVMGSFCSVLICWGNRILFVFIWREVVVFFLVFILVGVMEEK